MSAECSDMVLASLPGRCHRLELDLANANDRIRNLEAVIDGLLERFARLDESLENSIVSKEPT